jgi:membrane-associated phospholipid phosphatase
MLDHRRWQTALLLSALLAWPAAQAQPQRRIGDVLAVALPVGTLAVELLRGETQGALQYGEALAVNLAATSALQHVTHMERPDHSNHLSFPSGHASQAFSSATYVHRRYGLQAAWPLYLAAVYVGQTRVAAHRHRWTDIAGSAAVSAASTWWLVEPRGPGAVALLPEFGRGYVGVQVSASW